MCFLTVIEALFRKKNATGSRQDDETTPLLSSVSPESLPGTTSSGIGTDSLAPSPTNSLVSYSTPISIPNSSWIAPSPSFLSPTINEIDQLLKSIQNNRMQADVSFDNESRRRADEILKELDDRRELVKKVTRVTELCEEFEDILKETARGLAEMKIANEEREEQTRTAEKQKNEETKRIFFALADLADNALMSGGVQCAQLKEQANSCLVFLRYLKSTVVDLQERVNEPLPPETTIEDLQHFYDKMSKRVDYYYHKFEQYAFQLPVNVPSVDPLNKSAQVFQDDQTPGGRDHLDSMMDAANWNESYFQENDGLRKQIAPLKHLIDE